MSASSAFNGFKLAAAFVAGAISVAAYTHFSATSAASTQVAQANRVHSVALHMITADDGYIVLVDGFGPRICDFHAPTAYKSRCKDL